MARNPCFQVCSIGHYWGWPGRSFIYLDIFQRPMFTHLSRCHYLKLRRLILPSSFSSFYTFIFKRLDLNLLILKFEIWRKKSILREAIRRHGGKPLSRYIWIGNGNISNSLTYSWFKADSCVLFRAILCIWSLLIKDVRCKKIHLQYFFLNYCKYFVMQTTYDPIILECQVI